MRSSSAVNPAVPPSPPNHFVFLTEEHIVALLGLGKFPGFVFWPLCSSAQGCHCRVTLAVSPAGAHRADTAAWQQNLLLLLVLPILCPVQGFHLSLGTGIFPNLSPVAGKWSTWRMSAGPACGASALPQGLCSVLPCAG